MNDPCSDTMLSLTLRALIVIAGVSRGSCDGHEVLDSLQESALWESTAACGVGITFSGIFSLPRHGDFVPRTINLAPFLWVKFS